MKISKLYATIAALGALAVPSAMYAQEPVPTQRPAEKSPLVEVLRAVTEEYKARLQQQQWKETGKGLCYGGKEVGVKITDPTFGGADHHTPEVLTNHIFSGLAALGYNPFDVRSYENHHAGVIEVEYRGRKQGEKDGGLPTVVVTFHNPDSTMAYKTAWTFPTGTMELLGRFKYELPPTCQEFDRVMQERAKEGIRLDRPATGSSGDTKRGQKR